MAADCQKRESLRDRQRQRETDYPHFVRRVSKEERGEEEKETDLARLNRLKREENKIVKLTCEENLTKHVDEVDGMGEQEADTPVVVDTPGLKHSLIHSSIFNPSFLSIHLINH